MGGHSVAPTLIGTVYGMNFDTMAIMRNTAIGYPSGRCSSGMGVVLYLVFKRRRRL